MTTKRKRPSVLEIAWKQYLIDNVSESSRANTTNKLADKYRSKFTRPRLSKLGLNLNSQEYIKAYVLVEELCKKRISPFAFLVKAKNRLSYAS